MHFCGFDGGGVDGFSSGCAIHFTAKWFNRGFSILLGMYNKSLNRSFLDHKID